MLIAEEYTSYKKVSVHLQTTEKSEASIWEQRFELVKLHRKMDGVAVEGGNMNH